MAKVEVVLVDDAGVRWPVYDITFVDGARKRMPPGDPRATYRIFVPPDPAAMLRSYRFANRDDHALDVQTLAQQLQLATYTPRRSERPAPDAPGTKLGQ